jgi:hypothetical protein
MSAVVGSWSFARAPLGCHRHRVPGRADGARFAPAAVPCYGKTATVHAVLITCLWHGVFAARSVQVILIRDKARAGL